MVRLTHLGFPRCLWPSGPMGEPEAGRPGAAGRAGMDHPARRADHPAPRADWVPWLIAVVVFAAYMVISLSRYVQFDPGSWDLGIFTEYVKQLAHLRAPVANIRGRFQPARRPFPADRGAGRAVLPILGRRRSPCWWPRPC